MKQIIFILLLGLIFLSGCINNSEMKYQCFNGDVVDSVELCPKQYCPDLNCSECTKQAETKIKEVIKYRCLDGTVKDNLNECQDNSNNKVTGEVIDSVELCPKQNCPELNCLECPKQVETKTKEVIKYYCQDGTVRDTLNECQDNSNNIATTEQVDEIIRVDENTYNVNNVLVTIQLHHIEDKGIGEYIVIINDRDSTINIGSGCNYPISPYADGCRGWSIREYDDYPAFKYKYVNPNSKVSGWVWGLTEDFFNQYDTDKVKSTIVIDGKEISFNKTLNNIKTYD